MFYMTPEMLRHLGDQIRAARDSRGITQEDLAQRVHISRPTLSDYENGKTPPGVDAITEIANTLDVDFEVGGCVIERRQPSRPSVVAYQLRLALDTESGATVRIQPSSTGVLITAVPSQARSDS